MSILNHSAPAHIDLNFLKQYLCTHAPEEPTLWSIHVRGGYFSIFIHSYVSTL